MRIILQILTCFLFSLITSEASAQDSEKSKPLHHAIWQYGGLERADTTDKTIYLTFTGSDYNDGAKSISRTLNKNKVYGHFFFTGDFYRNPDNKKFIKGLRKSGHYLGPHSDKHLLYASWENRDSLLITKDEFTIDLENNFKAMAALGIYKRNAFLFMPPYEWYNQQISTWAAGQGLVLVNYTPGTRSNADYTTPDMGNKYISSESIYNSILDYEHSSSIGLNGYILLIHVGTAPEREDKFYNHLNELIKNLDSMGYQFGKLIEFF